MLRYYSYYSVGGYKDFFLGSNADSHESSYYISLLPVWEKRLEEKADLELQKKVDSLKKLPSIKILDSKENYCMPKSGNVLFSHGGYKLIFEHLEGDVYALAVRDIPSLDKDEAGRDTPFLFIITSDNAADAKKLCVLAAYAATNMKSYSEMISSLLSYDVEKNGLRFDLAALNIWIDKITKNQSIAEIPTVKEDIVLNARPYNVPLFLIPDGVPVATALSEQNLVGKSVTSMHVSDILPLDNPNALIKTLRRYYEQQKALDLQQASDKRLKELAIAAGGGALFGLLLAKIFG